ncbi:MAG: hypothetical protein J2P36_12305, partial [Ktedonobacteraceae bacterium]|nr:hypothetical protein [Ktedonobacteraceae bacterium]
LASEPLLALMHSGGIGVIAGLALGGAAYILADDFSPSKKSEGEESDSSSSLPMPAVDMEKAKSLGYRILHGKSTRPAEAAGGEASQTMEKGADDFASARLDGSSGFTFSQLLATGWRPSYKEIFLARLEDGTDVFIKVEDAVHIALAGSTRQGKTSIIRQLLAQLCYIGCCCILLDPHYTPYDVEINEDWTPFTPYLRFDPLESKNPDRMEKILRHAATVVLDGRKRLREQSKPVGTPIFIIMDEYPAMIAAKPKIQEYVALLLREGAKYKIFLCVASQDFQVKTVSPQSGGAIRDNYKTVLYVGGDKTTANVLLDTSVDPAIETTLGKGPVMLRCAAVKRAALAHTAFTDNQGLYDLLGPSTYQPSAEEEEEAVDPRAEMSELDDGEKEVETEKLSTTPAVSVVPKAPDKSKRPKATDIDINILCACWNGGANTVLKLEQLFNFSHGEAYKAYKLIMARMQQPVQEEQEQE